ncbi:MAG TPA: DUF692 domain-containing protein, partial [Acidimicrobiales bacterium]|nr:DUF692 domain-containing protein [Acidimicrobiales bacterium]
IPAGRPLPPALLAARRRGVRVVPHGVRLGLGGSERPHPARVTQLARLALRVEAPLVSEHVALVRGGGREAGHLLPVPRTRAALDVLVANVSEAMSGLPVPLALEPIASLFEWPGPELDEGDFLTELLERTGALLLLDVANVWANARNAGTDPALLLDRLPLDRLAYVHVAGGMERSGLYHDTHTHPVPAGVLDLLGQLADRVDVPGVMLERDGAFPPTEELDGELDAIAAAAHAGGDLPPARTSASPHRASEPTGCDRDALAAGQAALVSALLDRTAPPPRFDPVRLGAAGAALAVKRRESVRRVGAVRQRSD